MQVEEDDLPMPGDEPFQHESQVKVKIIVSPQRFGHHCRAGRTPPNLEAPGIGRRDINRLVPRSIEIHFKPGSVGDDPRRRDGRPIAGVWIFFVAALRRIEPKTSGDFGPYIMTIVDRTSDEWAIAKLGSPDRRLHGHVASRLRLRRFANPILAGNKSRGNDSGTVDA
jgi:hypothetical protein